MKGHGIEQMEDIGHGQDTWRGDVRMGWGDREVDWEDGGILVPRVVSSCQEVT